MLKKFLIPLCLAMVLLVGLCACSGALAAKEEKVYEDIEIGTEKSYAVLDVQEVLIKYYYLSNDADFTRMTFDWTTFDALRLFCEVNRVPKDMKETLDDDKILSAELQRFILERTPMPNNTPTPTPPPTPTPTPEITPFPTILNGDSADAVNDVQYALQKRNYFNGLGEMKPGCYDDTTEEAVRRFCSQVQRQYKPEEGLTVYLYELIMKDDVPEYVTPSPTPLDHIYIYETSEDVRKAQERLKKLGYFRDGEPKEWGYYDADVTTDAVRKFCDVNDLVPDEHGMDKTIIDCLFGNDAKENPPEAHTLRRGERDDTVKELQERLEEKGYYSVHGRQRTGKVDDDMLDAVADYARINHFSYEDQTVIPVDIQESILSENAKAYQEDETDDPDTGLVAWLTGTMSFMGFDMPRYLMILLGVVIVAGLVFLMIHAFGSGKKKDGTNDSWNDSDHQAPHGQTAPRVELTIEYRGSSRPVTVEMDKPLRIGRAEKTLPLDPNDTDISRRHCQMYFRGDALILRDYSSNGTTVNDQKYNNCECVVRDYDTIRIGGHSITVRILK